MGMLTIFFIVLLGLDSEGYLWFEPVTPIVHLSKSGPQLLLLNSPTHFSKPQTLLLDLLSPQLFVFFWMAPCTRIHSFFYQAFDLDRDYWANLGFTTSFSVTLVNPRSEMHEDSCQASPVTLNQLFLPFLDVLMISAETSVWFQSSP